LDYWLDLGNNADSGQFVLGEPLNQRNRRPKLRLRTVCELFPEIIWRELDGDGQPSCSVAEALERQEPFVNPTLANHALVLLARLFRYGAVSYHGAFVGLSSLAGVQALRVDPRQWQRFRRNAGCREISNHNPAAPAKLQPQENPGCYSSAGTENRALQPDILILSFVARTAADGVRSFGDWEYASGTAKWFKARCEGKK